MKTAGYSIKDLEILSGIKAHTIRIWEKRYNLLNPERTETNIRYYNDDDLRKILNVSLLVKNGYKISKVSKWDKNKLRDNVLEVTRTKTSEGDYIDRLLLHMINFDNISFSRVAEEIMATLGFEDAVSKIFFDFFVKIGTYWQVGSVFPAQEHYVTHIIRQKLVAAIDKLGVDNERDASILFFLPEKEMHELSL
ncbi:MAG: MerR family transcriptional regulator, partial [Prolixibacteraceae bacterium]